MKNDYLIVGQGLAGSLLAWHLLREGKSVKIIDADLTQSSSIVAAGIVNPLTGPRFTLNPQYPALFNYAQKIYRQISDELKHNFFIPYDIIRLLKNPADAAKWNKYKENKDIKKYVKKEFSASQVPLPLYSDWGGFITAKGGFCDTLPLLTKLQKYFKKQSILIKDVLNYSDVKPASNEIFWKDQTFKTIIFCEGSQVIKNPWFKHLPFQPVKGEILTLKIKTNKLPKAIINRGIWLVPYGKNIYKAGSSYNWDDVTLGPTEEVKARIVESLTSFLKTPFEIIDHQTGVRPATTDQQPIIGRHQDEKNICIFNGFGSKGVLLIPYYANQLCRHIISRRKLDSSVNIERFNRD